jgi:hypothetical protein
MKRRLASWSLLGFTLVALSCASSDDPAANAAGAGGHAASGGSSGHAGQGGRGGRGCTVPICTGLTCDSPDTNPTSTKECSVDDNHCLDSVYVAGNCNNGNVCMQFNYYCCDGTWGSVPCAADAAGGASGADSGGMSAGGASGVESGVAGAR